MHMLSLIIQLEKKRSLEGLTTRYFMIFLTTSLKDLHTTNTSIYVYNLFTCYYICRWFDITYAGAQPLLHLQLTGITNAGAIFYYICRYFITFAGIITFGVDIFITYAGGITFAGVITFAVVTVN